MLASAHANTLIMAAKYTIIDIQPKPAFAATSPKGAELAPSVAVSLPMPNTMKYAISVKNNARERAAADHGERNVLRGSADSFASVAELSKPTKLKITNGSAENTAPYLNDEMLSCAGSMTVPCNLHEQRRDDDDDGDRHASSTSPARDDNFTSR
jgi:hypothetical protein